MEPGPNRIIAGVGAFLPIARRASEWIRSAAAALVPERCLDCGRFLPATPGRPVDCPQGWCAACAESVVRFGRPFCLEGHEGEARWRCRDPSHLRLLAAAQYGGAIAELVRATKFRDTPALFAVWEEAWRTARATAGGARETCEVLVPIPAHPARVRERGFDVTAEWAERLARLEGVPCARALVRSRATPRQVGLDRAQRSRNVAGAFAPSPLAPVLRERQVVLVDDVVTTGATVRSAAAVVRSSGARTVVVWSLAYEPLE